MGYRDYKPLPSYVKAPCKGCKARVLGCHDQCKAYQEYKRKNTKARIKEANYDTYKGDIEDCQYVHKTKRYT